MARKLEKSKRIEEEFRRKSPRTNAALGGAWKAHRSSHVTLTRPTSCPLKMAANYNGQGQSQSQGPASRTRSTKKRKLRPLHQGSPKQGGEEHRHDDPQTNIDLWSAEQSKPQLPEKRVLEHILDVLQRRDIHEIFAEPVDPEEVEDYYEIIKEPMDFGTMRAKLHEGMYTNLGQFEHDIFLITKNAMHFNSSATIYFRQARAIDELAVRVFHVLKTHPESFELEFSESRRRNTRRSQGEAGNSLNRKRPKMARNAKPSSLVIDEPSKSMPCSLSTTSNIRRRNAERHVHSSSIPCSDARNYEASCGDGDDRGSRPIEVDRRCTFKPRMPHLSKDEAIISTLSSNKNQLERVIQQDIGYRESLMLFVKDLGPVIQTIARQKLCESFPVQNCQIPITSNCSSRETSTLKSAITAPISQNFKDLVHKHPTFATNSSGKTDFEDTDNKEKTSMDSKMAEVSTQFSNEREIIQGVTWWNVENRNDTTIPGLCFSDKVHRDQSSNTQSHLLSLARAGELSSSSFAGSKNRENEPTSLIDQAKLDNVAPSSEADFAHHYLKLSEVKLRNIDNSSFGHSEASTSKLSFGCMTEGDQFKATQGLIHVATNSAEAGQAMTLDRCKPWTFQFKCESPSLEARFGQLSAFGQRTFLQQSSTTAVKFFNG